MTARQLALPFGHVPGYAAADFIAADSNAEATAWLDDPARWPAGRLVLWGEEGGGKTHLLHAWTTRWGGEMRSGPGLRGWPAPPDRPVAVDDADAAAEEPLLHLLNAAAETGLPVLLAGRLPPAEWDTRLPDLASRLRAAAAVRLRPPDDPLLAALLARLMSDRQLQVAPGVADWLRPRLPRSPAALRETVARLDRAAWAGGRVTRSVAASVLAGMSGEAEVEAPEFSPDAPRLL